MKTKLSKRQQIEETYHNEKYKDDIVSDGYDKYEGLYYKYFWEQAANVKGLNVLDYGCGNGWGSMKLAQSGAAKVWGIDISGELIKKGKKWVKDEGLSAKISLEKMAGENLTFPDDFFDLILGSAILHHTEIELALKSIFRVLRPGGKGIFIEPLTQNIFLKIWRKLTPWRRSPTERALTNKDLKLIKAIFPKSKCNFFSFTSILSDGLILLFPNRNSLICLNKLFEKIAQHLLKIFPFLGKYCAVVVLELKK